MSPYRTPSPPPAPKAWRVTRWQRRWVKPRRVRDKFEWTGEWTEGQLVAALLAGTLYAVFGAASCVVDCDALDKLRGFLFVAVCFWAALRLRR